MPRLAWFLLILAVVLPSSPVSAQLAPGSLDVHWNPGSLHCTNSTEPPLQVHAYNANTFILRESLCKTTEAPFLYLLIGSSRALLIDSGDIADPKQVPLAETVMKLLPVNESAKLPLLVVHTHRHLDHRAGDEQFSKLAGVQVVGFDLDSVRNFYHFTHWPNGMAHLDLGERMVEVIPTPGHNDTEVSFYDHSTGLLFTGDFVMPARLLVDDAGEYLASARRLADFSKANLVSFALGGHIEMDASGKLFPWQSSYHPDEHVLQLSKHDVLALPAALASFNGFYSTHGKFTMMNSIRILGAVATACLAVIVALVWMLVRYIRRRRARLRMRAAQV